MAEESKTGGVSQAKAGAGEQLGQTIVTPKRFIIDKATGKIQLVDDVADESDVVQSAEKSSTVPQVPAAAAEVVAQCNEIESKPENKTEPPQVEQAVVEGGAGNKRLSAETLFNFALPEPMVRGTVMASVPLGVEQTERVESSQAASKLDLMKKLGSRKGAVALSSAVAAFLVVWFVLDYFSQRRRAEEQVAAIQKITTSTEKAVAQVTQAAVNSAKAAVEKANDVQVEVRKMPLEPAKTLLNKAQEASLFGKAESFTANKPVSSLTAEEQSSIAALSSADSAILDKAIRESVALRSQAVNAKVRSLANSPTMAVRAAVAKVLAEQVLVVPSDKAEVISSLVKLLNDSDYVVRGFAAKALGTIQDRQAKEGLLSRLDKEDNQLVQQIIRSAVARQ